MDKSQKSMGQCFQVRKGPTPPMEATECFNPLPRLSAKRKGFGRPKGSLNPRSKILGLVEIRFEEECADRQAVVVEVQADTSVYQKSHSGNLSNWHREHLKSLVGAHICAENSLVLFSIMDIASPPQKPTKILALVRRRI